MAHDEVPGQRSEHAGQQVAPAQLAPGESGIVALGKVTKMPWHDGHQVADLVLRKMDEVQRKILVSEWPGGAEAGRRWWSAWPRPVMEVGAGVGEELFGAVGVVVLMCLNWLSGLQFCRQVRLAGMHR
ncbi:hypothetical protein [Streptomyces mirabilis]